MAGETHVTLTYDSSSLFDALRELLGDWRMNEHTYDSSADEIRISHDSGGSGRLALTVVFEFDRAQMAKLLAAARAPSDQ